MSTIYLLYTPGGEPLFERFTSDVNSKLVKELSPNRIIKIVDYDEADPESGRMTILSIEDEEKSGEGEIVLASDSTGSVSPDPKEPALKVQKINGGRRSGSRRKLRRVIE